MQAGRSSAWARRAAAAAGGGADTSAAAFTRAVPASKIVALSACTACSPWQIARAMCASSSRSTSMAAAVRLLETVARPAQAPNCTGNACNWRRGMGAERRLPACTKDSWRQMTVQAPTADLHSGHRHDCSRPQLTQMGEAEAFTQLLDRGLAAEVQLAAWNPERDLLALATADGQLHVHRLNFQRLFYTSPDAPITGEGTSFVVAPHTSPADITDGPGIRRWCCCCCRGAAATAALPLPPLC